MIDPSISETHLTSSQLQDLQPDVGFHWDDSIFPDPGNSWIADRDVWRLIGRRQWLAVLWTYDPEYLKWYAGNPVERRGVRLNRAWLSMNLGYGRATVKRSPCNLKPGTESGVVSMFSLKKETQ